MTKDYKCYEHHAVNHMVTNYGYCPDKGETSCAKENETVGRRFITNPASRLMPVLLSSGKTAKHLLKLMFAFVVRVIVSPRLPRNRTLR